MFRKYYLSKALKVLNCTNFGTAIKVKKLIEFSKTQPKQKSTEWLMQRKKYITASTCEICITGSLFNLTLDDYITEKRTSVIKRLSNPAMNHGVLFEDVASLLYEKLYEVKVHEASLVPHRKYDFIAASSDGYIIRYDPLLRSIVGECLEIKVPYKRNNIEHVPSYYHSQMQFQLEVADIPVCNFFVVKINKVPSRIFYSNKITKYAGVIIKTDDTVHYPKMLLNYDIVNVSKFHAMLVNYITDNNLHNQYYELIFYRIEKYYKTVIYRNKQWFKTNLSKFVNVGERIRK